MKYHLIQSREVFGPPERHAELRQVWESNSTIFDAYTAPEGRPTFTEMFGMCIPDHVNVIANSDIYFDETIKLACPAEKVCYALSRWNVDTTGAMALWDHRDSQDAWIVEGGPHKVDADFSAGVAGCDNALIHRLQQAGLTVFNPSRTIRALHLHNVRWRSYLADPYAPERTQKVIERVPPPYAFVSPAEL